MRNSLIPAIRLATAVVLLLPVAPVSAQTTVTKHVAWSVDALVGHMAGPYSLNFQLIDGAGTGNGNVSVQVLNAPFSGFTLANSSFFEQANPSIAPVTGVPLEFDVKVTYTGIDAPTPDQFSFSVLDSTGFEIPTQGPADASATIDLTDGGLVVNTFVGDTSRTPNAGGDPVALAAPVFTDISSSSAVPEPGSMALLVPALGAMGLFLRRRAS